MTAREPAKRLILTSAISPSKIVVAVIIICHCVGSLPPRQCPPVLQAIVNLVNRPDSAVGSDVADLPLISEDLDHMIQQFKAETADANQRAGIAESEFELDFKTVKRTVLAVLFSFKDSDSLADFIKDASQLLVDNPLEGRERIKSLAPGSRAKFLTRTSFLGRFLHNICLGYKYLEFEKAILLWEAFDTFRRNTRERLRTRIPGAGDGSLEKALRPQITSSAAADAPILVIPQADLSSLVEHQIRLLETFGSPTPPEVSKILTALAHKEPGSLPSSHYVRYLECLKDDDFEGSFENLHRYFDYMMSSKQRPLYHYALLSLATLYSRFSCDQQAVSAIGEAIIVARENKDLSCLNYLLTWVYDFAKDRPDLELMIGKEYSDKQKILNFLKLHTKESKNKQLQSLFYSFRALQELSGEGELHKIFEDLTSSIYLSLSYDEDSDSEFGDYSYFAKSCDLTSTLWLRLGVVALAEAYIEIGADTCSKKHDVYDQVTTSIKKAYLEFYKENYDGAFQIFDDMEELVSKSGSLFQIWESRRLALLVRMHLKNKEFNIAAALLSHLEAQSQVLNDVEFRKEINSLNAQLEYISI